MTTVQLGRDSSGRPVLATPHMADWWEGVLRQIDFTPTIVQGAFMAQAGGGASDSAGYHDGGGCLDLRTWDLTAEQTGKLIRVLRRGGAGAWVRDQQRGGMDPHIHLVLGSDRALTSGAADQWRDYLDGFDGLATRGRDYHWRPDPLVTVPPDDYMEAPVSPEQEDRIAQKAADRVLAGLPDVKFPSPDNPDAKWSLATYLKRIYKR